MVLMLTSTPVKHKYRPNNENDGALYVDMNDITFKQKKHRVSIMMNTAMWSPIEMRQPYTCFLVLQPKSFKRTREKKKK